MNSILTFCARAAALRPWTLLLPSVLASLSACKGGDDPASAAVAPPRPVLVADVRSEASSTLSFVGEVRAAQRAELGFAVSGVVSRVGVDIGAPLRKGDVLAQLDPLPLQAQARSAEADALRAQAQVTALRQRVERMRQAQAQDAASPSEWSELQAELAAAEAAFKAAQAQREAAAWSLKHAELRAPMDGVLAGRSLEVGQAVAPGAPVMSLDGAGRELLVQVPEEIILKPGQALTLVQGTQQHASRVLRLGERLQAGGMRQVHLLAPAQATVGSTWTVQLAAAHARGDSGASLLRVPLRAIKPLAQAGQAQVLRLSAEGQQVELVQVQLGRSQGDWVEVSAGLQRGDRVVLAGAHQLPAGTRVKPVSQLGQADSGSAALRGARP